MLPGHIYGPATKCADSMLDNTFVVCEPYPVTGELTLTGHCMPD